MTAQARRLRNGLLRPWVVDYMTGREELARLQALGLEVDLDADQAHALGVALSEQRGDGHTPVGNLTPSAELMAMIEDIAQARDQAPTQAHNQEQDQAHGQRLTPANRQARGSEHGPGSALDQGQAEHAGGAVRRNRGYKPDEQEG